MRDRGARRRDKGRLTAVRLRDTETGSSRLQALDGLFVSIGHEPASGLFVDQLACDSHGFVWVDPDAERWLLRTAGGTSVVGAADAGPQWTATTQRAGAR